MGVIEKRSHWTAPGNGQFGPNPISISNVQTRMKMLLDLFAVFLHAHVLVWKKDTFIFDCSTLKGVKILPLFKLCFPVVSM